MADTDSTTLRRPETRTSHGDSDEYAHIVMRDDQMRGYVSGEPIKALCGKLWVPSRAIRVFRYASRAPTSGTVSSRA